MLLHMSCHHLLTVSGRVNVLNALQPDLKAEANAYTHNRDDELFEHLHDEVDRDGAGDDVEVPVVEEPVVG